MIADFFVQLWVRAASEDDNVADHVASPDWTVQFEKFENGELAVWGPSGVSCELINRRRR